MKRILFFGVLGLIIIVSVLYAQEKFGVIQQGRQPRFQLVQGKYKESGPTPDGSFAVWETIGLFKIDTESGEVWELWDSRTEDNQFQNFWRKIPDYEEWVQTEKERRRQSQKEQ